jgi:hypothetical protein
MPTSYHRAKPLMSIVRVAKSLGWQGLQMWQHRLGPDDIITWYSTSDEKFFLQINEHPIGQTLSYAGAVHATRYSICTGWHKFELSDEPKNDVLHYWLNRRQFRDRKSRRRFCENHPECCFEKRKRRPWLWTCRGTRLPPYFPDDPKPLMRR